MLGSPETSPKSFGSLLAQTARQWRKAIDRGLRPYGLTEATWLPLVHLSRAPTPLRQKQLAEILSLDGSAVVRLLDALQKAGLIERREEAGDRRAKSIILTDAGRELVVRVEDEAARLRDHALEGLDAEDVNQAMLVLEHICRRVTETSEVIDET